MGVVTLYTATASIGGEDSKGGSVLNSVTVISSSVGTCAPDGFSSASDASGGFEWSEGTAWSPASSGFALASETVDTIANEFSLESADWLLSITAVFSSRSRR